MKAFIAKIRKQADIVQDLLLDAADSLERSEVAITAWKSKAITEKSHALEAAEETIDRLIAQREEARKIAEEFRDNFHIANPDSPHIPLPWEVR